MKGDTLNIIDTIVGTLLQVAHRVLEVSYDGVVSNCWDKKNSEQVLDIIQNEAIVQRYNSVLKDCIKSGESQTTPHNVIIGNEVTSYTIRVLPIHQLKDHLFITIEFISRRNPEQVAQNYWEEALDAAGDGMWDVFVPDERIAFSERWHSVFGYNFNQLNTIQQWVSIIHPNDVASVQKRRLDYFEGKTRYYHSEFRLKCEDGTYKWVLSRGVVVSRAADGSPIRFTGTHTDINDRKIAEERFAATAQLLAKLINNLQEGILVTDEHKKIVYANQMFCDIYNIAEPPETLIGMAAPALIESKKSYYAKPEYFSKTTIAILEKGELVLNQELEMANGRILNRDHIPLTFGTNNKGCIWKLRDITAQKNTEKQLADLRNFYEQILNSIATDIVVFDAQQRYLFINPTAVKDDELRKWLIGKTDEDYCHVRNKSMELVDRRRKIFIQAREEKRNIIWEEVLVNRDGQTEYHIRVMCPIFDDNGNHQMGIGYGINITDRVRTQQELKTSMDTFASAFNDSGIGMALVSPDGKWLDVNNVLCEMTGFSKDGLMQLTFRDITHPDDLDIDLTFVKKILRKKIRTYSVEKRYISRYNKIIQALLTVSLVRDIDDKPKFYIAQVIDITAKKELEWQLRNNNAELQLTKENLLNKINQLEDLSYIIAHNLRGPAGNIKMLAEEAMLTQLGGINSGDNATSSAFTAEEALCMIHDGSISLLESLSTLMQITEIKLNKEIPYDECDIATMINEICIQLQSAIYEKQAILRRHYDVTTISYPRAYLENILYNLISNALKYTRDGIRPEIFITTRLNNERVQLIVKDNGLGIDTDKYADKLFKLNGVFHTGFESKGVGLYITKTQVESFGGSIELKSKPNQGCEFIVTL